MALQPGATDRTMVRAPARGAAPATPGADRELVAAVRAELAAVEPARACCRVAELAGVARPPTRRRERRAPALARLVMRLGRSDGPVSFDWEAAADHCRLAHLRGRFLAGGSLSLAGGRTHLEFVVPASDAASFGEHLRGLGLPASTRTRRGVGVVTWKSAETVATFLRRAGAPASALELEARLVARTLRGELNRAINAEHANLRRQVAAAARQLDAIDDLETSGRLARLPELERSVAAARRESPEATFGELSARLGIARSLVQRALARLEDAAFDTGPAPAARARGGGGTPG